MKSILLAFVFLFLTFISTAQPIQGDYILGGSLGFNFTSSPVGLNKRQGLSFSIAPSFGKFISEKYLLDGGLSYSYRKNLDESSPQNFNQSINNTIHIRFRATRFFPIVDKLFFTVGAYINSGYGFGSATSSVSGIKTSSTSRNINGSIGISPGLTYFINNRWMVYSSMGTINYFVTRDSNTGRMGHTINASLTANSFKIGISYIFERNKNIKKNPPE